MSIQRNILVMLVASSLGIAAPVFAQATGSPDQPVAAAPNMPGDNAPAVQQAPPDNGPPAGQPAAPPSTGWRRFGGQPQAPPMMAAPLPAKLTVPAGTWITIRVDQPLSSDRNQPGDFFAASLAEPLVADGIVVARRGQMIGGTVTEAMKAGRAKGVSHLGLQLTEMSLVDGRQVPVKTQLVERRVEALGLQLDVRVECRDDQVEERRGHRGGIDGRLVEKRDRAGPHGLAALMPGRRGLQRLVRNVFPFGDGLEGVMQQVADNTGARQACGKTISCGNSVSKSLGVTVPPPGDAVSYPAFVPIDFAWRNCSR